jgi:hypothetical protein
MRLLVVVINDEDRKQDVLEAMLDLDIRGITIMDTENVVHLLAEEAPIFVGLRQMFSGTKEYNKTVFGVSDRDDVLACLDQSLKEVGLDLSEPNKGYAFTVPVENMIEGPEE